MPNIIKRKQLTCLKRFLRDVTSGTCTVIVNMKFGFLAYRPTIIYIWKLELQVTVLKYTDASLKGYLMTPAYITIWQSTDIAA